METKPNVVMSNEEFIEFFKAAEERGRKSAEDQILSLQSRIDKLVAPKSMETFHQEVSEVKTDIRNLEGMVRSLDENIQLVVNATQEVVESINKNTRLLTILHDSAKLGLTSLNALTPQDKENPHIKSATLYLDKAISAYYRSEKH